MAGHPELYDRDRMLFPAGPRRRRCRCGWLGSSNAFAGASHLRGRAHGDWAEAEAKRLDAREGGSRHR